MAIYADEDGLFTEDSGDACLSCGFPGHVEIADQDEETAHAYWSAHDGDETVVAAWESAHPEVEP